MQPAPAPSAGRGDVVLQPAFFTSILYVQPLREDVSTLTERFREQYSERDSAVSPFSLFKQLWRSQGWKWLHFKVFDDRARETFLLVTARIFLERLAETNPVAQVVGLFGAYTFHYTQPEDTAPKLCRISHIPIPIDHFQRITRLSESLSTPYLVPLREPAIYVASTMVRDQVFYILPSSDLGPENPRHLPREVLIRDSSLEPEEAPKPKKKGRPSLRDQARKAQMALDGLNDWLDAASESSDTPSTRLPIIPHDDLVRYHSDKTELIAALGSSSDREAIRNASAIILNRLREAQIQNEQDSQGLGVVERVERALQEYDKGISHGSVLGLLEGAGDMEAE